MSGKLKPYPKYKESGVEWLGEVPEGWVVIGFKKMMESIVDYRGKTPEKHTEGIFLVTARNIKKGKIDYTLSQEYITANDYSEVMSRGLPQISDVVFTTEAPLGEVANIDNEEIALAQRIIKFRGRSNQLCNYFLKYFIMSYSFQVSLYLYASGSTALGIKAERLCYLFGLLPPRQEQTTIANYLDQQTTKIDKLIEHYQKLIALSKEKRTALITHCVTKGLDPTVKMKNSGVEWLGEVPEHWVVQKMKYSLKIKNGQDYKNIQTDTGGYPVMGSGGEFARASNYLYEGVSILFGRKGTIDKPLLINGKFWTVDTMFYSIIEANRNPKFIFYRSTVINFDFYSTSTALPSMTQEDLNNITIGLPSLQEQTAIANYLDQQTAKIDQTITKAEQAIELLKEKRTALITAVVTGKVDVRECI
ncbi:restriction endonuclease subunit S [Fastidiosibacter lacustris]|uniref:restriction endonuclease subunit S n=1 Tax=Fastidiosibacter lacustris TaxID=2056695 RepID=UPI000E34F2BC|nr:restriction endonuclease subunit S [Fastidiosibacter lacustris]